MAKAKVLTSEGVVEGELVGYKEIEYMQRNIAAVANIAAGVDSKADVIQEVGVMLQAGWTLFATHYAGQNSNGSVAIMHIFVR